MANRMERKYHLSFSWQHEREERFLDDLSRQGLHMKKAGLISYMLERDTSVRYTYRLDYQSSPKGDKREEYLELYRDAGWEYMDSFGAMWHYFRRPWQPGENPELYTDRESLVTLYKRLRKMMVAMLLLNLFILCLNSINLVPRIDNHLWSIVIPVLAIYILIFLLLGIGIARVNRKIKTISP